MGPALHSPWTSIWFHEAAQVTTSTWPLVVTWAMDIDADPDAAWPQTQTWPSADAQGRILPWPQVAAQAAGLRLFLSTLDSLVPPLHSTQTVLLLFLSHLSTTHLHVVVATFVGRYMAVGGPLGVFCCFSL